jgi:uncharacterized membrane protein (DUF4010 family)
VIYRLFGERAGILTSGILGGLISSTATTVSYSRRSRETPALAGLGAVIVMIATAVLYFRILLIIGSTARGFLPQAVLPIGLMFAATSLIAWRAWCANRGEPAPAFSEQSNPTELKTALMFAVAYSAVLVGIAAAREYLGQSGLYVVGALSGLTDMDAIALSIGELVTSGKVNPQTGWRVIVVASLSNLVFKAAVVAMLGTAQLLKSVAVWFAAALAAGVLLVAFWPA